MKTPRKLGFFIQHFNFQLRGVKRKISQRIANSNPLFPYLKSIHPTDFEQYISHSQKTAIRKTRNRTQIQGNFTIQKTADSRLIRIGTIPLPKDRFLLFYQSNIQICNQ